MTGHALGHAGLNRRPAEGALHDAFVEVVSSLEAGRRITPAARRREDRLLRPLARGGRQFRTKASGSHTSPNPSRRSSS
jgi:hypothetical protein